MVDGRGHSAGDRPTKPGGMIGGAKPTLLGLASGGAFALAAIGFRGAILSLNLPDYVMAATFTLVIGLAMQSVALSLYLSLRRPAVLFALLRAWKPSLFTGFMGALARSSGFSLSHSRPRPVCARWRSSKFCSRKWWRATALANAPASAKPSAWCSWSPAWRFLFWPIEK